MMVTVHVRSIAWDVYWLILARIIQAAGLCAAGIIGSGIHFPLS